MLVPVFSGDIPPSGAVSTLIGLFSLAGQALSCGACGER